MGRQGPRRPPPGRRPSRDRCRARGAGRSEFRVTGIAHDPEFHYQPALLHYAPDDAPEAMLPPGPRSPVGVVWISLSRPHYGIHGTRAPEAIGYTSSAGCVRLTNWGARRLADATRVCTPVELR